MPGTHTSGGRGLAQAGCLVFLRGKKIQPSAAQGAVEWWIGGNSSSCGSSLCYSYERLTMQGCRVIFLF